MGRFIGAVALILSAAVFVYSCEGDDVGVIGLDESLVEGVIPIGIEGTWDELGPTIGLALNFTQEFPNTVDRLLSFTVDGVEFAGRPNGAQVKSTSESVQVNVTLVLNELSPGDHGVRAVFVDRDGRTRSVEWRFTTLRPEDVTYGDPAEESEVLVKIVPPPNSRGTLDELGRELRIDFTGERAGGLGGVYSLRVRSVQVRDVLSCSGFELSQTCTLPLDSLGLGFGTYTVRLSFTRPPDLDRIRRVEWNFVVVE